MYLVLFSIQRVGTCDRRRIAERHRKAALQNDNTDVHCAYVDFKMCCMAHRGRVFSPVPHVTLP